jgi:hypothetical protein
VEAHTFTKQAIKLKQTSACQKADGNCFLRQDWKGVVMVEFMQQETTIMSEAYCKTLEKLHRPAIQNKRCGVLPSCVVLLHDDARPHTAARSQAMLQHFNWELFGHPPYSSDLILSNYHLFI